MDLRFHGALLADYLRGVALDQSALQPIGPAEHEGVLWQASGKRFLISIPEIARFLVVDGRHIAVEPAGEAVQEDILRILHMTPLAALCFQRGILALHAAVAAGPHGAVLIAGDSSSGKSTLLAALVQRGWRALTDDLALLDFNKAGQASVVPTFPEILLWPDSAQELAAPVQANATRSGRNPMTLSDNHFAGAEPLRAMVWLGLAEGDDIEASTAQGAERFQFIGRLAYNSRVADALMDRGRYLASAGALASLPLHIVRRPSSRWSTAELAAIVERLAP